MTRDDEKFTYMATPNVSGHDWATQAEAVEDLRTALGWEKVYLTDYELVSSCMVCRAYQSQAAAEEDWNPDAPTIERF